MSYCPDLHFNYPHLIPIKIIELRIIIIILLIITFCIHTLILKNCYYQDYFHPFLPLLNLLLRYNLKFPPIVNFVHFKNLIQNSNNRFISFLKCYLIHFINASFLALAFCFRF
jgi:hypothetical protein